METEKNVRVSQALALALAKANLRLKHPKLTPAVFALLEDLALAYASGQAMTVMQALELTEHGSPATLHRRLTALRQGGYLTSETNANDSRIKYLVPTEKTANIIAELSGAISNKS